MYLPKRIISVICAITIVFSCISPTIVYAATDSYIPVTFWEYVYRYGFSGGNRPGGFGGGGFGGSGPDDWTSSDDMKSAYDDYVSTLPAQATTVPVHCCGNRIGRMYLMPVHKVFN